MEPGHEGREPARIRTTDLLISMTNWNFQWTLTILWSCDIWNQWQIKFPIIWDVNCTFLQLKHSKIGFKNAISSELPALYVTSDRYKREDQVALYGSRRVCLLPKQPCQHLCHADEDIGTGLGLGGAGAPWLDRGLTDRALWEGVLPWGNPP